MIHETGNNPRPINPRNDLRNHSPTGIEWGYAGSGPAQLALALAAEVTGSDYRALDVYQRLKFELIAGLPVEGFTLTEDEVRSAILTIEAEQNTHLQDQEAGPANDEA
jgi:hypothetical protein